MTTTVPSDDPTHTTDASGRSRPHGAANVGVIFGGPSPEHDPSILTGLQAARELTKAGRAVVGVYWSKTGDWYRVSPTLEAADFGQVPRDADELRLVAGGDGGFVTSPSRLGRSRPLPIDVALVCCHGAPGEDGSLQGALDLAGVPYTGPSVAGAALGMDKLAFAGAVSAAGLRVLPRRLLRPDTEDVDFPGPYIVKPRFGGSSLGIKVVADIATALGQVRVDPHLRGGAVVEPYRPDLDDLNVAVRRWPALELSAIERPVRSQAAEILGYADKYIGGEGMASAPRELPARISGTLDEELRRSAAAVADLAEVRGVARVDFLSDGSALYVNEINTIPGSLARYLWVDPPMPFLDLLDDLLAEALVRPAARYHALGADGSVLRDAGSIAAKLA